MVEQEENWIERRQRMVRCKTHGLHFDPRMSSGCVLCVKEWARLLPQRAPQFTIVLLCVLGMAVILYQVFGPGRTVGNLLIVDEEEAPVDPRLDPEPYRQAIETLETGLFATVEGRGELLDTGTSFAAATRELSGKIQRRDPPSAGTADAIARLGAATAEAFGFAELENLRDDWLRLRRHQFLSADWFRFPVEGSAQDRVMRAEHREVARGLRALLYEGAAEIQALVDAEDPDEDGELWQEFTGDWRRRLDELWSNRPHRPSADADAEFLIAIQELERAFHGTRTLASDRGLVRGDDPGARFDDLVEQVDKAERGFDAVKL